MRAAAEARSAAVAAATLQRREQQGREVWRFTQKTKSEFFCFVFGRMGTGFRDLIGLADFPSGRFKTFLLEKQN